MNKALNGTKSRILCAIVSLIIAVSLIFTAGNFISARAEEEEDNYEFTPVVMNPTNNQFASSSGSFPKTPDSWTGGGVNGHNAGNVVSGVMDLDTYAKNKDSYKLSEDYPAEFPENVAPDSPFGPASGYENTNRNVLFINVRNDGSQGNAYGYTSSSLSLSANRFYQISVWVRTGNFAQNTGAAIRLNGLDDDVAFTKINTVSDIVLNADNDYGWQGGNALYGWDEYKFLIASPRTAKSVTISLQVGDSYTDGDKISEDLTVGYAMFDNITAEEISPSAFYNTAKSSSADNKHVLVQDYTAQTPDEIAEKLTNLNFYDENASAGSDTQTISGWTLTGTSDANLLPLGVYDGASAFNKDNKYNLTADPLSANGKYTGGDSSILILSSYRNGSYDDVAIGYATEKFTVKRHHYYRVSAWVKTQDVENGSGATLGVSVIRNPEDNEYEGQNVFGKITSCTGESSNLSRGGYKQYYVYVKGSVYNDYEASVECWLGTIGAESRGIAMFDNITVEEIQPSDYNTNSTENGAAAVDLDTASGENGNSFRTLPDTGIENGTFLQIADYEKFDYPLAPASWVYYTPDTVGTDGYSSSVANVNSQAVISGLIPTDEATFDAYNHKFDNAVNPRKGDGSILMIYSPEQSAACYRSANFTVSANAPGALTVSLYATGMAQNDYGASLVLKDDSRVIATIEGIKNNSAFTNYTFYIEPNSADISSLSVEIWLGNVDRKNNLSKLSSGYVFVDKVSYAALSDDTSNNGTSAATKFAEKKAAYENAKHNGSTLVSPAYSFKTIDFNAVDVYDTSYVKYPYDWQLTVESGDAAGVKYGIFDPNGKDKDSTVTDSFKYSEGAADYGVLMLNNLVPAASRLQYNGSIVLSADTYYKVDVSLRVALPEEEIADSKSAGATLFLTGTDFAFKNIKDTSVASDPNDKGDENGKPFVNNDAFRTYTFYINPGSSERTVSLAIALGNAESISNRTSGRVYLNSITYTDITNVAYDEAVENEKDNKYVVIADLSTPATEEENPTENKEKTPLQWYVIPSILFAAVIVIAIVGFIIRKALEKRAAKKTNVEKTVSYDRNATLHVQHNQNKPDDEEKVTTTVELDNDEQYESFDDDATTSPAQPENVAAPATEAPAETETTESAEATTEETPAESAEAATENAETPTEEATAESTEAPAATDSAEAPAEATNSADNAYIDQFDD